MNNCHSLVFAINDLITALAAITFPPGTSSVEEIAALQLRFVEVFSRSLQACLLSFYVFLFSLTHPLALVSPMLPSLSLRGRAAWRKLLPAIRGGIFSFTPVLTPLCRYVFLSFSSPISRLSLSRSFCVLFFVSVSFLLVLYFPDVCLLALTTHSPPPPCGYRCGLVRPSTLR